MDSDEAARRRRAGDAIKDRRGVLGNMTQRELAEKSGVDVSTVQEIESGQSDRRHNHRTLSAISDALEWPPSRLRELLYGEDVPPDRLTALEEANTLAEARIGAIEARLDDVCDQITTLLALLRPDD